MGQQFIEQATGSADAPPRLRRVLGLWDLIFYGIVLIQPIAPVGILGVAGILSKGHVATTILIAMMAMMLTAQSYGRMAVLYPAAGSAYVYVARGLNPYLGFLVGWVALLDYLIIPVINVIYVALTMQRLIAGVPYLVWVALTVTVITVLNLRGIRFTAWANQGLLAVMSAVIVLFVGLAVRYLFQLGGWGGLVSVRPFYDPKTFHLPSVATATSLAALTYIGFDGVSTLAEEVKDPKRTVPLATVLVCLFTGLLSTLEIYLAQRVWPDYLSFPAIETAFLDVCARVGGAFLFNAMAAILVVACFGSGLAGQVGAARLLFAMGRDGVLPGRFFGYLSPHSASPTRNILFIGLLGFGGAAVLSYERAAELLNFGAFLAFMGVNLATIRRYYFDPARAATRGFWRSLAAPALGFLFCAGIWISLPTPAKIAGGVWLALGLAYQAIMTGGFQKSPPAVQFSSE